MAGLILGPLAIGMGLAEGGAEEKRLSEEEAALKAEDKMKASEARMLGGREAATHRMETSRLMAKQGVAYANAGVDRGVGTAAQVQANTAAMGEYDAQQIENNAARAAWGFETHSKNLRREYDAKRGANQRKAWGTVIGGAGQYVGAVAGMAGGGGG